MAQLLRSVGLGLKLSKDFSCDVVRLSELFANILIKHLFIANLLSERKFIDVEFDFIFLVQPVKRQLFDFFMRVRHICMLIAECSLQFVDVLLLEVFFLLSWDWNT